MRAGQLDRKVAIEQVPETQDARGEPIAGTPTIFAPWWAQQVQGSGDESQAGDQKQFGTAVSQWKGRYLPGVTPKMRLNDNGVLYDIIEVDESARGQGRLRLVTRRRAI